MTLPAVPPELRFRSAMEDLLESARAMASGEVDPDRRLWALRLAQRSLDEAGGKSALPAHIRRHTDALVHEIAALDQVTVRRTRAAMSRLRHGAAEVATRQGRSPRGRQTDRNG